MLIHFLIAAVVFPFLSERFAVSMPNSKPRSLAFYLLTPLMGALVYSGFLILTAHPYLALAGSAVYYFGLTAISNKKYQILCDPFNAHDFDNARHFYIYPEFYVGYVGWPVFILILASLAGLVAISLRFETAIPFYTLGPWYIVWPLSLVSWVMLLWVIAKITALFFNEKTIQKFGVTLDLQQDVARFGLFPTILLYRLLLKAKVDKTDLRLRPLKVSKNTTQPENLQSENGLADIIVIQGESYFDLERFFTQINPSAKWAPLRDLENSGVTTGQIEVPTRGAYTMQSEFSFLTGFHNNLLGIDGINPYMRLAQRPIATFVSALRQMGYRTLCIHPAKREFFRRSDVMPNLGFDEFVGLEAFKEAERFGEYVSDKALGDEIDDIVAAHHASSKQPLFIFAITIESHGPWAKGRLEQHLPEGISEADLQASNITSDAEFPLYQAHMENLLAFYRRLSVDAPASKRQRITAMYGDHLPAINHLFETHGFTGLAVDYLLWNSDSPTGQAGIQKIEGFAETVLAEARITLENT